MIAVPTGMAAGPKLEGLQCQKYMRKHGNTDQGLRGVGKEPIRSNMRAEQKIIVGSY